MEEQSYGYHTRITSKHSVSTAIVSATCMLRRLVLGEGDAVDDAWLFSFHMTVWLLQSQNIWAE